mgnify:CR=1 FL=1
MNNSTKKRYQKPRFWLWILLPILWATVIINGPEMEAFSGALFALSIIALTGYLFIMIFSSLKHFYNGALLSIAFGFIGILFKMQHWPGAGVLLVFGLAGLAFGSLYSSFKIISNVKSSNFLKWFGFAIGYVLFAFSIGVLFKIQHYPYGNTISFVSLFFIVISIMALVFTLPSSNYIDWSKEDKKIFYRSIITPMVFLILLSSYLFIFRSMMQDDFYNEVKENSFRMSPIELLDKPGIN